MCGFAGKLSFKSERPVDQSLIKKMTDKISHRGPDAEGFYFSPDRRLGLGFRRLSIIDLSPAGNQPMTNEDQTLWIVFNGEIYNFPELRAALKERGHSFRSRTDTECVLHLYEEKGIDCLRQLRGMFSFAIWDSRKQELFLARDRLGKKPLKYYYDGSSFIFASELKAILADPAVRKEIDDEAIDEYLTYQYVPHPKTGFKNIWKLEPAHYLLVKADGSLIKKQYWSLDFSQKLDFSESEWEERVLAKLRESVRSRLISDVSLGAYLSGGIDSSLVVALMAEEISEPVKTFSIGFEENDYNELPYARLIAERYRTDHHELIVRPNALEILPRVVYHYEEPYADSSALATWYLARETKKQVTVALNGDGGDENFAGYTRYQAMKLFRALQFIPFKSFLARFNRLLYQATRQKLFHQGYRFLSSAADQPLDFYLKIIDYFSQEEKELIYTEEFKARVARSRWHSFLADQEMTKQSHLDSLDRLLLLDIQSYLPDDLLVKVDIASMAHGLETRSPFLDHEFMELTAQMSSSLKLRGHNKKYLLKKIAYRFLPRQCVDRPKHGFGLPLEYWFRGQLRSLVRERLLSPEFLRYGFRKDGLLRLISDHEKHRQNYANHLWALLMLREWLGAWFEK